MKVFIVMGVEPYESRDILGVYRSREEAEAERDRFIRERYGYREYEVEEWEVR